MKKLFVGLLFLAACSDSSTVSVSSELPANATLEAYDNGSGLSKATIKSGETIIEEGDVLNGQRHGTWTTYFPDGKIQTITSYLEGKKQGPEVQFDNSGYVVSKTPYVLGNIDGQYKAYTRGKVTDLKTYKNGKLSGLVQRYYPNGTIMEESTYVDGTIDGEATWYNQEGEVSIKYVYDMGKLVDDGKE